MPGLDIHPVTSDRWGDLQTLFGPNGAYSNCWCTWWILSYRDWEDAGPEGRKKVIERQVASGGVPGLLAYDATEPVGWVSVGPRERYARMMSRRSSTFRPLDDEPSWVINCFFVHRARRGRGIAPELLAAAVRHAHNEGATRIEAYPQDTAVKKVSRSDLFVGSLQMFLDAGFGVVTRIGNRPVVRLEV